MTMANEQRLRIIIEAVDRASQTIESISRRLATNLRQVGRSLLIAGGFITGFAALAIRSASSQQRAFAVMQVAVEATGRSYDQVRGLIEPLIQEQARLSKFNKTEVAEAFQTVINLTGDLDAALRLLPSAVILGSATGKPVKDMAEIIARALRGEEGAIKQLKDFGLQFGLTEGEITRSGLKITVQDVAVAIGKSLTEAAGIVEKAMAGDKGAIGFLSQFGIQAVGAGVGIDGLIKAIKPLAPAVEAANTPLLRMVDAMGELANIIIVISPFLKELAERLEAVTDRITAWAAEHPKLASVLFTAILIFALVATAVGAIILAVRILAIAIGTALIPALAFLMTPLGILILGLALLALGIGLLILKWGDFKIAAKNAETAIRSFWEGLKSGLGPIGVLLGLLERLIERLKKLNFPVIPGFQPFRQSFNGGGGEEKVQVGGTGGPIVTTSQLDALRAGTAKLINGQVVSALQHGGIVTRPTLAMIGERGPEAVIPLGRGAGGMNSTIVVNVNGPVYGVPDLKRVIVEAVREQAERGGFHRVFGQGR